MTTTNCQICGRALENLDSRNRGISAERQAKPERFLAAAGSNDAEIVTLALCGDPTVTLWIAMVGKAIGSGLQDHVNRFIEAALLDELGDQIPTAIRPYIASADSPLTGWRPPTT